MSDSPYVSIQSEAARASFDFTAFRSGCALAAQSKNAVEFIFSIRSNIQYD